MSFIGLDIGTTGCKAIAFDALGTILAKSAREYGIQTPHPGWVEQDAEQVFQLAWQSLQEIVQVIKKSSPPSALALSVQGEAIIPVTNSGRALRPAILGMDTRTNLENEWLAERFGEEALFSRTGMPLHTINTLPKLLWLKWNEPDLFQAASQFLLYEDFFIRKFTGKAVISHCLASRTQMYDLSRETWAEDILEKCALDPGKFAELASPQGGIVGKFSSSLLAELGLTHDILVVSGGHDQACAALGCGVIEAGKAMVSTGTAEVMEVAMSSPNLNESLRQGNISIYRHVVPSLYLAMTLNHSGGLLLRWFRDSLCEPQTMQAKNQDIDAYDLILQDAPVNPTSLFVLPHFSGSGTPRLDIHSRGAILGLDFSTTRSTLAKAILEGLTFELRINLDLLKSSGIEIEELHAVGGGAKSRMWLQMKADICQIPLRVPRVTEAACLGAALLAGTGEGYYPNVREAVHQTVTFSERINVNSEQSLAYERRFRNYEKIYPALKAIQ